MPGGEGHDGRWAGPVRGASGSLTRQAVVIAAVTLMVDCLSFFFSIGSFPYPVGWRWAMLAAIVVVDAGLAGAPRSSGVVAVAQAAVAVGGTWVALTMWDTVLHPGPHPVPQPNNAGLLISAYRAGAWLNRWPAVASLVCLATGTVARQTLGGAHIEPRRILLDVLANALLPWLVGRYTTARRAYIAELEQRSEREQREARQALTAAIAEERSSIARDLHDVISHHVSAIGIHAGAARLRATTAPDAQDLTESLTVVETSSRAAMLDLRRLLDLLHGNQPGEDSQPGLDNLPELLDAVRAVGLRARVTVHGVPSPLPESLDIAVYRVVQEMLTNALRHGAGGVAEVELRYGPTGLTVTASNPFAAETGVRPDSPHRGLQGIRSRVTMFKGSTRYGPTPDGRTWITTVTFPLDPS
ncbi:sensor histidine kinase [Streptosporangium subroseum]|uniref:sensor histidine kinase n=1 Tax=Streptosporangium subroseum TaxID=106412 RepID=UPI001C52CE33|nr:histidine kinase [Streptosporangium subroseum]